MDEQSVWKKEISFRRKPKGPKEPKAAKPEKAARAEAEAGSTSVWKKEISFGRKRRPEAAAPAPEPVAAPEPDAVVPATEVEPLPHAVAAVLAPLVPEAPSAVEPPVEDVVVAEPVEPAPEPEASESWDAAPELPPAPEVAAVTVEVPAAQPEPVVLHPPVSAEELPVPEPTVVAAKVPFWKKDISLGGKTKEPKGKKAKEPKAEKPAKAPKEQRAKQPRRVRAPKFEGPSGGKRIVGLKVGASQLAAARVSNNGVAELLQVAREPLAGGIIVGGELRQPDALAEALKEFFDKHRLPKKGVRLGIANNRIGVRTFEITGINDPKQLANAIRFRAQEALPIPIEDAVLDYQILSETPAEDGQVTHRVLLVVAYRDLIDRYVEACRKAGITLSGIDLEAFALLRALQAPQAGVGGDSRAALVAVAIGHERSTFAVSDGRVCEFTRVLEWGGSALNVALARALDAAPSEVEELKRSLPLTDESVPDGISAERAALARDAMRRAIQVFARELVSSLQFYQNQPDSLGIGEIVLSGGTAHLAGIAEELERLIGAHVRVGDPLARMKVSKKIGEPAQVGSLAVAIGLGIED